MISQGFSGLEIEFSVAMGTYVVDALENGSKPAAGRRRFSITCDAKF